MRRRPVLALSLGMALALACFVWAVLVIGRPLPPRTVVMTTGTEGGVYREFGEKYRAALARDGIDLVLRPSQGNLKNLARLNDASSGVSVGFGRPWLRLSRNLREEPVCPYPSLRISFPSATRSGASSSSMRGWFTWATMIWPTSVCTSEKRPCDFIFAVWYWLSSVGLT